MRHEVHTWLPGVVLGLYGGRMLSEWWRPGPVWAAALLTLACVGIVTLVGHKRPFPTPTWPFYLLVAYVLYPAYNPEMAALVGGITAVTWIVARSRNLSLNQITGRRMAVLAGFGFFLLYWRTLAPDLLPADSGEFQLVAARLGVAHPPGFPFYTLLAYAAGRLPLPFSAAYQVNLLSALISAATLALVYAITYRLTQQHLAAGTAVIALGSATTFWAQATTANIRSLTAFFATLMLYALVRFWELRQSPEHQHADRWLFVFALALGWGITHHASLIFMGLVFALFLLVSDPALVRTPRRWLRPFLAAVSGLLPLLYLPLRAFSDAPGALPALATWSGFLDHVLARGFRGDLFYFTEPAVLWQRLLVMGNVFTFQFAPWLLLGMGAGLLWLLARHRLLALLLGGSFLLHTLITATYRAPQTVEYMLPAYVPAAVVLGVAAGALLSARRWQLLAYPLAALLLGTTVRQTVHHYPSYALLHQNKAARDYAQPILEQAPPSSVILADWHWVTPLWYIQQVEGQRPDVTIRFVAPAALPYAETWAEEIAAELASGKAVIATHFDENAYHTLPPAEPIGEAFLYRQEPRNNLPAAFTPLDTVLGGVLRLVGYHVAGEEVEAGGETAVTLAWEPLAELPTPLSFFAHLVGSAGQVVAQEDLPAKPQPRGLTLTRFHLTPRPGTGPGTLTIGVGAYADLPLLDATGAARTPIASLVVTPMSQPPFTSNPLRRPLVGEERTLVGYDWDTTLPGQTRLYLHWQTPAGYLTEVRDNQQPQEVTLPAYTGPWGVTRTAWTLAAGAQTGHYVPFGQGLVWLGEQFARTGSPVMLPQRLAASRPVTRDLVISVRLIGYQPDGFYWAWTDQDDGVPALGAIPTLKWIAGSQVRSPHTLVPAAQPGQLVGATLRLYDAFTNRPLAILDERITDQFPWVPLGQLIWPED